ncbi:MAG: hypothetical protein L0241_16895 [Planctomycetia bacterium]|nr:hypothetical protein [Planctomycetia bacterium]
MPRVLFWNVQRKQLDGLVLPLVLETQPDLLVLVEYPPISALPQLLQSEGYTRGGTGERFGVFARGINIERPLTPFSSERAEPWLVTWAGGEEWVVVVVHGPDRRNAQQDDTRAYFFRLLADHTRRLERDRGHRRTLVLGDFNADPYEASVLGANGLHALGVPQIRTLSDRRLRNAARTDFFYNPMWRLYGTTAGGAAGTATYYYREGDEATEPFWHMFDVVIRPEFADRIPPEHLRILNRAAVLPLVDANGLPDHTNASDHLPVVFTLT